MPVISEYAKPKGNAEMILFGERNDDTVVELPTMEFPITYAGNIITNLYVSGNSFIGFGVQTEHLKINRRDASYNKLFYSHEVNRDILMFRVRFEGNSSYSSWNSNDLIWELVVFMDGTFMLIVEKSPRNGTDSFNNPTIGTQVLTFEQGKSYVFSLNDDGSYNVTLGSYVLYDNKYLMQDIEGVKKFDMEQNLWVLLSAPPITKAMFTEFGVGSLPNILDGLNEKAKLLLYTTSPDVIASPNDYKVKVREIVTSKPKIILQTEDFEINSKIESIEIRASTVGGDIRFAMSFDGGNTYYSTSNGSEFFLVDVSNVTDFTQNGMDAEDFSFDYAVLNTLITDKLRFAYLLTKPNLTDICKLKAVKINYEKL